MEFKKGAHNLTGSVWVKVNLIGNVWAKVNLLNKDTLQLSQKCKNQRDKLAITIAMALY